MGGKALGGKTITNAEAFQLFEKIVLENNLGSKVEKILLCGSARRGKKTSGDLDIVFIDRDNAVKDWLKENFGSKKNGKPQTTVLIDNVQVEFYEATSETWGSTVLMWTGSAYNNIKMRRACKKKGLTMSQYGIKNKDKVNLTANMSEQQIFEFLEMDYLDPTKR
jgi:DNA polymerase/3'-5' exonuclease PolX